MSDERALAFLVQVSQNSKIPLATLAEQMVTEANLNAQAD